ncbi:MAG TPA: M48 family metalloprotease [Candidatus Woesearchaeota archaeon]|nr:M48 family metalloprotease [Candidatus Woesearchaeota archaeon]
MRSMFEETRRNKIMSYIIVSLFFVLIGVLGATIGLVFGTFWLGLIISFVIFFVYFLVIMSAGDKMILGMSHAKPAKKEDYPFLVNTVEGLSISAGFKSVPEIYVIEDKALNAFATGLKPEKSMIAVTSGLLDSMNREQIEAVIAHEMSHIKNQDSKLMIYCVLLAGIVSILSNILLRSFWFSGGGKSRDRNSAQVIFIVVGLVLAILAPLFATLIRLAVSRQREYVADSNAAILCRNPNALAQALEVIMEKSSDVKYANSATSALYIENPLKKKKAIFSNLFSTHPPIEERIKRLREM